MSPPIRDGSGSSIGSIRLGDGSEISEVRTGAGDVVFSARPDSVVLNATGENYDGSQFVSTIGPNIPDINGNPSIVADDLNGFDAVQYQKSNNDESETTTTIATSTSIAIVSTFKKLNRDDNANVFDDPAGSLTFGLNDDSAGRDWIAFIADTTGTQQKLKANFTSSDTNYHTYAYGIGSELFFSQDGDRKAVDANVTASNPLNGINIADSNANMSLVEISVLDGFATSELANEISRQRNKYGL